MDSSLIIALLLLPTVTTRAVQDHSLAYDHRVKSSGKRSLHCIPISSLHSSTQPTSLKPHHHPTLHNLPSPRPRSPLNLPLNITRNPPPVKIPRLRLHLLPIDKALPRPSIKAHIPPQRLKALRRTVIRPGSIPHLLASVRRFEIVVGGPAFPFAEGAVGGPGEGDGYGCWGEVVRCSSISRLALAIQG